MKKFSWLRTNAIVRARAGPSGPAPEGPLTLVDFAIGPGVDAFPVRFTVDKLSFISVTIGIALHASTVSGISLPLPLVDSCLAILHDTQALSFTVEKLTAINSFIILFHAKLRCLLQNLIVKDLTLHSVIE